MRICSISLVTSKMQTKATIIYNLTLTRGNKIKKEWQYEISMKTGTGTLLAELWNDIMTFETCLSFSYKVKHIQHDAAISLLYIYAR